ncbi:Mitochondrial zinc maintenance protein 1, mitochondrial [Gnomoniopsis sp. IMI 355080]|nr:Mitochondrial zinc maintenance protein 1, mitochondrial [Gnomoniopsis sp. IMI 355080]
MALPAYRSLFRATRLAFQGDERMLTAARTQIRANFREKATLPASDPAVPDAIQHAEAVAAFLRANVVQGKREGNDGETYKLRIHEHTHRGDNDSIKSAGGGKELLDGGGCCSS